MGAEKDSSKAKRSKDHKKSNSRRKSGSRVIYVTAVLCVIALLAFAFYLPQFLFQIRDNALCGDTVLGERENMDILIGNSYELSLYDRMRNFAGGLARGMSYYVSEQDMEVDDQLYELLYGSVDRIFQNPLLIMVQGHLVSSSFLNDLTIVQRKQYVIYSDDYAQGVNFIIWYLEIAGHNGEKLELLMDAETYTLYGIKSEKNGLWGRDENIDWREYLLTTDLERHLQIVGFSDARDLWLTMAIEYEAISISQVETIYYAIGTDKVNKATIILGDDEEQEMIRQLAALSEGEWRDENELILSLPYGEYLMDLRMQMLVDLSQVYRYHDVYLGFDAICGMIPEFMEEN